MYNGLAKEEEESSEEFYGFNTIVERQCSEAWPICLYDFTFKSKQTSYFCFRIENLEAVKIEDYFYPPQQSGPSSPCNERVTEAEE